MENSKIKNKLQSHRQKSDLEESSFQHIRPKPRTKRKSKQHASVADLQMSSHGVFSPISESSICFPHTNIPPAIPLEHHPSVSFLPIYQPQGCCPGYQCCHHKTLPKVVNTLQNSRKKTVGTKENLNFLSSQMSNNDYFNSLPPAILSLEDDLTPRRFSDPGLGNDNISLTSDETREVDDAEDSTAGSLDMEEELLMLKKDYVKLSRELTNVKKELLLVKTVVTNQNVHSPTLMADIIKEIQSAADMREEAFLNRVQSLVEYSAIPQVNTNDCNCKNVLQRLELLENQMRQTTLNYSSRITPPNNIFPDSNILRDESSGNPCSENTGYSTKVAFNPFTSQEAHDKPSTEL